MHELIILVHFQHHILKTPKGEDGALYPIKANLLSGGAVRKCPPSDTPFPFPPPSLTTSTQGGLRGKSINTGGFMNEQKVSVNWYLHTRFAVFNQSILRSLGAFSLRFRSDFNTFNTEKAPRTTHVAVVDHDVNVGAMLNKGSKKLSRHRCWCYLTQ